MRVCWVILCKNTEINNTLVIFIPSPPPDNSLSYYPHYLPIFFLFFSSLSRLLILSFFALHLSLTLSHLLFIPSSLPLSYSISHYLFNILICCSECPTFKIMSDQIGIQFPYWKLCAIIRNHLDLKNPLSPLPPILHFQSKTTSPVTHC